MGVLSAILCFAAVYAEPETGGLELTEDNVEMVLDDIRPYLMAGETTAFRLQATSELLV